MRSFDLICSDGRQAMGSFSVLPLESLQNLVGAPRQRTLFGSLELWKGKVGGHVSWPRNFNAVKPLCSQKLQFEFSEPCSRTTTLPETVTTTKIITLLAGDI